MRDLVRIVFYCFSLVLSTAYAQSIGGVVNAYVAVTSINQNGVNVTSSQGFSVGDKVLLIQMKGATISTGNNATFGQIQSYGDAGNFEFTNISSINGNAITFTQNLCKSFSINGFVQLIRVPVYNQATITSLLTGQVWNGSTGGVVAIEATSSITFNANLSVQGLGFNGGAWTTGFFACGDMNYANSGNVSGKKGEGIVAAPVNLDGNRAPLANGGGGSNSGNPGAGGGSNGGAGGRGGNEFYGWCTLNASFGMGGYPLNYSSYRAFLGGGGGGGYRDNGLNCTNGSRGGGIVFLISPTINGNNFQVIASGANVIGNTDSEGAGGGGAGGCVYLLTSSVLSPLAVDVKGGNGGNIFSTLWSSACHGPGGGGGGGAIVFQQSAIPPNVNPILNGGASGSVLHTGPACAGTPHGAQPGANGILVPNYVTPGNPVTMTLGPDTTLCLNSTITLQPDTLFASYTWSNGATTPTITVGLPGIYWLEVPSGCGITRDSIYVGIQPDTLSVGPDIFHCLGDSTLVVGPNNYQSYQWSTGEIGNMVWLSSPGIFTLTTLDALGCVSVDSLSVSYYFPDTTLINAAICSDTFFLFHGQMLTASGNYTWNGQNQYGCDSTVTLDLLVNQIPIISALDTVICANECVSLYATGAQAYVWANALEFGPQNSVCPSVATTYSVYGIDSAGCISMPELASIQIEPLYPPDFSVNPMQVELSDPNINIANEVHPNHAYVWNLLGNLFYSNEPSFTYQLPFQEGSYPITLYVTNDLGCSDSSTLYITINNTLSVYIPNTFTPDGEEHNDVFIPVFSPGFTPVDYEFTIFNRWGEVVFVSFDQDRGWDGTFGGILPCQVGVYTYRLSFKSSDGINNSVLLGSVNLIH